MVGTGRVGVPPPATASVSAGASSRAVCSTLLSVRFCLSPVVIDIIGSPPDNRMFFYARKRDGSISFQERVVILKVLAEFAGRVPTAS